jgi:membrane AbrB-like protein
VVAWFVARRGLWLSLFFGALGAWLGPLVGIPGGSFTGAMLATGLVNLRLGMLEDAPQWMLLLARVLLGLSIGVSVTDETIQTIARSLGPVSLMIVAVTLLGLVAGWAINRYTGMRLPTALCAAAPGALPAMVTLSEDLGGEAPVVATMHLIRLVSILLIVPTLATVAFPAGPPAGVASIAVSASAVESSTPGAVSILILAALGVLAGVLGRRLKLPAGEMLAPMLLAAVVNPAWLHIGVYPAELRLFSNWIIGLGVGASISMVTLRRFRPYALAGTLMTAFLILSGLALGWLLTVLTDIDLLTAILGCSPGGATALITLSGELGADAQLVAAMHVTRMIILMVMLPVLIKGAARRLALQAAT